MQYVSLFPLLVASTAAMAAGIDVFRGQLECSNCGSFASYTVQITDQSKNPIASGYVSSNGDFAITNMREGVYWLYVRTQHGDEVYMQPVNVSHGGAPLMVRLPEKRVKTAQVPGGVVSVKRLQHKVPKQARKHFNKAQDKSRGGDHEGALKELLLAIEIDPEYTEAWNNLGARYIYLGQTKAALNAFNHAVELDPTSAAVQSNVAMVLLLLGDSPNAELAARRALESDPSLLRARYMLGLSLHSQHRFTEEAKEQLRRVQDLFPNARLALAEMAIASGKQEEARTQLKAYLNGPDKSEGNRAAAERLLVALR
jgi:Flp pilus assembly protein TadD